MIVPTTLPPGADQPLVTTMVDDPLARWRFINARREAVIGAIRAARAEAATDYWTSRATAAPERFQVRLDQPSSLHTFLEQFVQPTTTVLDVGAGWGRFAIPLAQQAAQVTAVEPVAVLLEYLTANRVTAGVPAERLQPVAGQWLDVAVAPADLVLCANVILPIPDAGPFLQKLHDHANRYCVVAVHGTPVDQPLPALWQEIHGVPYPRETTHVDALAVLGALGIPANLTLLPGHSVWSFATPADAARFTRDRLWLGPVGVDPRADQLLADWLTTKLVPAGDRWVVPVPPRVQAVLWWEKANP